MLAAILPLTGWFPPSGPYRALDRLSPAQGNPDETRRYEGSDLARAYLRRQVERSDWQRWRSDAETRAPFARAPWSWTLGPSLDPAWVLGEYPVRDAIPMVLIEVPLIALDRSEVILRAQTHGPEGVDDHTLSFRREEDGSWSRAR